MQTVDGHELNEGDECFVSVCDPMGEHAMSPNPRRAHYMDDNAKYHGWDFTIYGLRVPDIEVEVVKVWKHKPI